MPWEDYLETHLPAGSRFPQNFKIFDFFDRTTGVATSAETLDTTTAVKMANPNQIYSSIKGNIDAAAGFTEYGLKDVIDRFKRSNGLDVRVIFRLGKSYWCRCRKGR
ncbi:hypothetical protein VRB78_12500 [Pseudomonas trivialis]|uniref:endonuclease toxin domain-containing protein n=1 Tax=Pseudomonas trivialis TaxID=200450 RepID=UPI0030CD3C99